MKVVIIVIDPTIGSINELVTLTSTPPLATTKASSPPDDKPNPVLSEVHILTCCTLDGKKTVKNYAAIDTNINTKAGSMNVPRWRIQ